jgi:hypothetical protein
LDRLGRAVITNTIGKIPGIKVKDPVYFQEIGPELKALYGSLGEGLETGARFQYSGTTKGVLRTIEREIAFWDKVENAYPKNSFWARQIAKRKAFVLKQQASLTEIRAGVRTGEVFTGSEGSTIIKLGQEISLGSSKKAMKALGLGTESFGYIANTPVRALVAADSVLMNSSFKGHKAATLTRNWMRTLKANKGSRLVKKTRKVFKFGKHRVEKYKSLVDKNGKTLIDDIAHGTWSAQQVEQARLDALYYMYRRDFQSAWGKKMEKVLRMPGFNNAILFAKTRTNILKNTVDASPLGIVTNAIPQNIRATVEATKFAGRKWYKPVLTLDTTSSARVIRGMLLTGLMKLNADLAGGRFVGPPDTVAERKRRQAMRLPNLYYEHVSGYPELGISPLQNFAPLTGMATQMALLEEFQEDVKLGREDRAMATFTRLANAFAEESMYSDVRSILKFVEGSDADPEDPGKSKFMTEKRQRIMARWISSRMVPNIFREIKQSGKFLGINIPGYDGDPTVVEPSPGTFGKTLKQTLLHDLVVFGKSTDVARKPNVLTGEKIERTPRYSPRLINTFAYLLPSLMTAPKGYKPVDYLSKEEWEVGKMLERYDITLPEAPVSIGVGGRLKLTTQEKHEFIKMISTKDRYGLYKGMLTELNKVADFERRWRYSTIYPYPEMRKEIQGMIRDVKEDATERVKEIVVKRLWSTSTGRARLWHTIHRKRVPWKDDEEHRTILKKRLRDANFWVTRKLR